MNANVKAQIPATIFNVDVPEPEAVAALLGIAVLVFALRRRK